MCSAISLGVFWRAAPSTSAIMRSRNDSPGLAVMRTTMRSESTLVPPVTAERSPPLSRMTGADSPVIADSSTEAMPSTTSPSPGMSCPASTTTRSPLRSADGGTRSPSRPSTQPARAWSPCASCAASSACALPRPSATASAKLAKSTVNQSQMRDRAGEPERRALAGAVRRGRGRQSSVVSDAADLDHEHDRVLGHRAAATSLRKLSHDRRAQDRGIEQRQSLCFGRT